MPIIRAFVQARMSSRRFPGKVLAPFRGQPIVRHVVERVRRAVPAIPLTVLTSHDPSDDPLAAYLDGIGVSCYRGPLDDVFGRFRAATMEYPCEWILRVCADSPLIEEDMLRAVVARAERGIDLVTTILPRTYPRGCNAELIAARALQACDDRLMTAHDREHVTPYFHRQPERYRIVNVESGDPERAHSSVAVDTVDDLLNLEAAP